MYIQTISESKFQTFRQCQLKYRYRYVERLPEPEETNTEALHFGSYIHKILEEGVNDRVIEGKDGGYLIIDYKTSKREKSKVELYQDSQLKGYVYAISKLYDTPISNVVAAHYYPLTNNFVFVQYSVPQINSHLRKVVDQIWTIRKKKKDELRATRNEFCNWCAYKTACPEFNDPMQCTKKIEELKAKKKSSSKSRK